MGYTIPTTIDTSRAIPAPPKEPVKEKKPEIVILKPMSKLVHLSNPSK